jgi:SAM-dependent methyltransferase
MERRRSNSAGASRLGRRISKRLEMIALTELNRRRRFTWRGETYPYCVQRYNSAWHNERTVEVPIAFSYLRGFGGHPVLEVGNVLSHYMSVHHEIIDKYERAPGVLNLDVVDYSPSDRYDLIISLSTLEHVGWDEAVREEGKPLRAVDHLVELLAPGGTLLVTFPLGYNPHVDTALQDDAFRLDEVSYLKRISRANHWREIGKAQVGEGHYGRPFPAANVIAIGRAEKP